MWVIWPKWRRSPIQDKRNRLSKTVFWWAIYDRNLFAWQGSIIFISIRKDLPNIWLKWYVSQNYFYMEIYLSCKVRTIFPLMWSREKKIIFTPPKDFLWKTIFLILLVWVLSSSRPVLIVCFFNLVRTSHELYSLIHLKPKKYTILI